MVAKKETHGTKNNTPPAVWTNKTRPVDICADSTIFVISAGGKFLSTHTQYYTAHRVISDEVSVA